MARYIEEKDVYKLVEPRGVAKVHCSQIDELPRADVVPKSEVEKLQEMLDATIAGQKTLQKHLANVKTEVAREIFEDIRKALDGYLLGHKIAEVEKKYTEEGLTPTNTNLHQPCKSVQVDETEKDYFSPEDVRRMTASDVKKNYQAIMESMKKWNGKETL